MSTNTKNWQDEYFTMVEDCENRESQMSEWECNFIESIRSQIEDDRILSSKQIETLENIWDKVTRNG